MITLLLLQLNSSNDLAGQSGLIILFHDEGIIAGVLLLGATAMYQQLYEDKPRKEEDIAKMSREERADRLATLIVIGGFVVGTLLLYFIGK